MGVEVEEKSAREINPEMNQRGKKEIEEEEENEKRISRKEKKNYQ